MYKLPSKKGAKKRKLISQLPLENCLIFQGLGLLEVALQQAGERAAVSGLVAGHLSRRRAGRFASYGGV